MIEDSDIEDFPGNRLSQFPVLLDYDFLNNRPRGASLKLDVLSGGKLFGYLENLGKIYQPLFIKKSDLFLKNGFFLHDLKNVEDFNIFLENFICSNRFNHIYVERDFPAVHENLREKVKPMENL